MRGRDERRIRRRIAWVMTGVGVLVALPETAASASAGPTRADCRSEIAFVSTRDGDAEIFVMNSDGSNVRQLTHNTVADGSPEWSPDGRRIAFDRVTTPAGPTDEGPHRDIFVMRPDGTSEVNLTKSQWHEASPTWSPDGRRLAFHSKRDGDFEIYAIDGRDGSHLENLTNHHPVGVDVTGREAADVKPAWSRRNGTIAFESYRDEAGLNSDIWVMAGDGTGQAPLVETSFPAPEWFPAWSPDGSRLAYMAARDGRPFDIVVANADGTGEINITANPKTDVMPAWSDDGSVLAFGSNLVDGGIDAELVAGRYFVPGEPAAPDNFEIFTIRPNGTRLTRLTTSPGEDIDPSFRPRSGARGRRHRRACS